MMQITKNFKRWLEKATEDNDVKTEINFIKYNHQEIYERFYKNLEFGTAGLRGIIGAGPNRINVYTVRLATQALANYINREGKNKSVAISFDSRIKSDLFAREAACVLVANGIIVWLTEELQPTPVLSFAVRLLKCDAGIMITASHNPSEYNGYKCYGSDGCQITEKTSSKILKEFEETDIFDDVKVSNFNDSLNQGKIKFISKNFYDLYISKVMEQRINKNCVKESNLSVVYTPLNGAGNKLIRHAFKEICVNKVYVVPEQEFPDGNFTTCKYPNPEIKDALKLALNLADLKKPDLVIATDPDCDRVGIAVRDTNEYRLMTGNEVGILLTHYILSQKKLNGTLCNSPVVVKTIVSSPMIDSIVKGYNCEVKTVLTGFKYIGEQILKLEERHEESRFVFGFEESYGYLAGTYVRDKDAVVASVLICEMISYYKIQGKTILNVLNQLYKEFGFYKNTMIGFEFKGSTGMKKIQNIMGSLRKAPPKFFASSKIVKTKDYLLEDGQDNLPKSNVLSYFLENGGNIIIRPSGTEPKIKSYITAVSDSEKNTSFLTDRIIFEIENIVNVNS